MVTGGALLPLQASFNAQLAAVCGSAPLAAAVSFAIGFVALAGLVGTNMVGRPRLSGLRQAPPWAFLGGLTGAWFITMGTFLLPLLGATKTMGLVVGGQLLMGLVIDHFGWLGIARRPLTPRRLVAGGLVLGAVGLLSGGGPLAIWPMLGAVAAGCGIAVGFSANSEIARHAGHPLGGALVNFLVGSLVLAAVVASGLFGAAQPAALPQAPAWAFLGGVFGAAYVTVGLIAIPRVGLAVSGLATVFGQLAMSMLLDVAGLLGPVQGLSASKLGGALLLLVAMAVLQGRRAAQAVTGPT